MKEILETLMETAHLKPYLNDYYNDKYYIKTIERTGINYVKRSELLDINTNKEVWFYFSSESVLYHYSEIQINGSCYYERNENEKIIDIKYFLSKDNNKINEE